jgi:predicted O-methyltransferase YrrM
MSLIDKIEGTEGKTLEEILSQSSEDGMIMEFGVGTGGSIRRIANHLPNRTVYGFDSFEGLPENWRNGYDKGHFKCDPPKDLPSNVHLVIGLFQDTLETFLKEQTDSVAFLHMDADLYSSTSYVLNTIKDQLRDGTIILFDEFCGYTGFEEGEYKAFQEFLNLGLYTYTCISKSGHEQVAFRLHSLK